MGNSTVLCEYCGKAVSPTAAVCPGCGADLKAGKWKTSDRIALGALIAASVTVLVAGWGAIVAYNQFRSGDDWKRREFVAAQIKDFYTDNTNANILRILDYNPAIINLRPGKKEPTEQDLTPVTFEQFVDMINNERNLEGDALLLRQQFEHFLLSLARLEYLVRYKAIQAKELCVILEYPLSLMSGDPDVVEKKRDYSEIEIPRLSKAIRGYMERWQPCELRDFFKRMAKSCGFKAPYIDQAILNSCK